MSQNNAWLFCFGLTLMILQTIIPRTECLNMSVCLFVCFCLSVCLFLSVCSASVLRFFVGLFTVSLSVYLYKRIWIVWLFKHFLKTHQPWSYKILSRPPPMARSLLSSGVMVTLTIFLWQIMRRTSLGLWH